MKLKRKIVRIDEDRCNGCGLCVPSCAEGAIRIIDGKAKLVAEKYCDGLGACLRECPQGALEIVEEESDPFDESAVFAYLRDKEASVRQELPVMPRGCPSSLIQDFRDGGSGVPLKIPGPQEEASSAINNWPLQIRLVPPNAPFLNNADMVVAADCTSFAYGDFHQEFLKEKTVLLIGCPKFDDLQGYVEKFTQIFQMAEIRSIVAVVMEVPCCQGLPEILKRAMLQAGRDIPLEVAVISTRGERLILKASVSSEDF